MEVSGQLYCPVALPSGKDPPVLTGPQSWSGRGSEEKKFLPLPGIEPRPARRLVTIMTELLRLLRWFLSGKY